MVDIEVDAQTSSAGVAVGSVVMWAGSATAPTGWLVCDGKSYSQSQYPELYDVIKLIYTPAGTPSADFCVPDLQGLFVRGVDSSGTVDPDYDKRVSAADPAKTSSGVGSLQQDEFKSHSHSYTKFPGKSGDIASGRYWESEGSTTGETGGSETRPKNMYLYYIIKAQ